MDKWLRVAKALDVFQYNVWPSEEEIPELIEYVAFLRRYYEELKWVAGFQEAACGAKAALFRKVAGEEPAP